MGTLREIAAGCLVLVLGCAEDAGTPPIVFEGEHLRFGTDGDVSTLCGGTLAHLDGLTGYLGAVFGVEDPKVDYFWLVESLEDRCRTGRGGCADGHAVYSEYAIHQHEIVHAVRNARDIAYRPFEEGLAEAFGDDWPPFFPLEGDVLELWENESARPPSALYPLAGYFVSYLGEAHGRDAVTEFAEASSYRDSWSTTRARFSDVFGTELEDAVQASEADYPRCEQTYYRDNGFACGADAVPLAGDVLVDVAMGCDEAQVLGPRRGERWTTITFEVAESADYLVGIAKLGGARPGRIDLRGCGQSCMGIYGDGDIEGYDFNPDPIDPPELPGQESVSLCLPAGRYVMRFSVDSDDTGDFRVSLRGPSAVGCE